MQGRDRKQFHVFVLYAYMYFDVSHFEVSHIFGRVPGEFIAIGICNLLASSRYLEWTNSCVTIFYVELFPKYAMAKFAIKFSAMMVLGKQKRLLKKDVGASCAQTTHLQSANSIYSWRVCSSSLCDIFSSCGRALSNWRCRRDLVLARSLDNFLKKEVLCWISIERISISAPYEPSTSSVCTYTATTLIDHTRAFFQSKSRLYLFCCF